MQSPLFRLNPWEIEFSHQRLQDHGKHRVVQRVLVYPEAQLVTLGCADVHDVEIALHMVQLIPQGNHQAAAQAVTEEACQGSQHIFQHGDLCVVGDAPHTFQGVEEEMGADLVFVGVQLCLLLGEGRLIQRVGQLLLPPVGRFQNLQRPVHALGHIAKVLQLGQL